MKRFLWSFLLAIPVVASAIEIYPMQQETEASPSLSMPQATSERPRTIMNLENPETRNRLQLDHFFQRAQFELERNNPAKPSKYCATSPIFIYVLKKRGSAANSFLLPRTRPMAAFSKACGNTSNCKKDLEGEEKTSHQRNLWAELQKLTPEQTAELRTSVGSNEKELKGWLDLSQAQKMAANDPEQWQAALVRWEKQYPDHPGKRILENPSSTKPMLGENSENKNIALLLPLSGKLSNAGSSIRDGFLAAYSEFSGKPKTENDVIVIDTAKVPSVEEAYRQAVQKGARFILGPLSKEDVDHLLMDSAQISVPTLALNYSRSPYARHENLFQFGLSPLNEARQLAQTAWHNDLQRVIVIYPKGDWGERIVGAFESEWKAWEAMWSTNCAFLHAPISTKKYVLCWRSTNSRTTN